MTPQDRIEELEAELERERMERKRLEALFVAAVRGSTPAARVPLAVFDHRTREDGLPAVFDFVLGVNTRDGSSHREHTTVRIEPAPSRFLKAGWHRFYLFSED